MIEISYSTIEFWFCTTLIVAASIQLFYYLFFYLRISIIKRKPLIENELKPVSVIICAKNEEENLRKNLPQILEQDYPNYEVVVVNDCSEDNSEYVLRDFTKKYKHLHVSAIKKDEKFSHGKKLAITIGIKAATHNTLLFTDADCVPTSNQWIRKMQQSFRSKTQIVLGYGGYEPKSGFLDKLIRYDTLTIAVNYMSFAHAGVPYMGVGRNMAYTREIYERSSKFQTHNHIASGDDDLFVKEVASGENTEVILSPDSFTRSEQSPSFRNWKFQKRRHLTTSPHYKFIHKILLCLEPFSRELFYLGTILWCILQPKILFIPIICLLGTRMLFFFLITILNAHRFKEPKVWIYALLFDIYMPLQIGIFHLQNKFKPLKSNW